MFLNTNELHGSRWLKLSPGWRHVSTIPTFGGEVLRQENCDFQANLGNTVKFCLKKGAGARKVVGLVKHLPYKHEDLRLDPWVLILLCMAITLVIQIWGDGDRWMPRAC